MEEQGKYYGQRLSTQQVTQLYDAGVRDFRGAILHGNNFQGANLPGVDFSHADIRGANFNKANLTDGKFTDAKAGIPKKNKVVQFVFALLICWFAKIYIAGTWYIIVGNALNPMNFNSFEVSGSIYCDIFYGLCSILFYLGFITIVYRRGFLEAVELSYRIIPALAIILSISTSHIVAGGIDENTIVCGFFILLGAFLSMILTVIGTGMAIVAISIMVLMAGELSVLSIVVFGALFGILWHFTTNPLSLYVDGTASILHYGIILVSFKISRKTLFGDHKFESVRDFVVNFSSWLGTRFVQANLSNTNFERATLENAKFRAAKINCTCFHLAKRLEYAHLKDTILADPLVQELVVSLRGKSRSFAGLNLRGAYLVGADLSNCDFTEADLSHATIARATLTGANLTQTQVLDTDFSHAELTGTTIEGWNTDSTTCLDGIMCDYVYLLNGQRERRPNSGVFQAGEFTQLFQEVLDTIDLIFQNGIDWKAFARTFAEVQVQYENTELSVQSIENKGEGAVVVKLSAPPEADKAAIHQSFSDCYQTALQEVEARYKAQLEAKDEQIVTYRQTYADMNEIANLLAKQQPTTVNVKAVAESKSMQGNDNSRNVNIGGDFNASGSNVNINLGEISGQISNDIRQLPDVSADQNQPSLKELLTQLKGAVEQDTELSDDEKAEALGEVAKLVKAGSNPKEGAMQRMAKRASTTLKAIAASLTDASTLATACKKLLPMIAVLF